MVNQPNNQSTVQNPVGRFMVAAGAVVELNDSGKILITQRALNLDWHPGEWEICYGRIDQFEDLEMGLRREVKEELGLTDISIESILTTWHIFRGPEAAENELIGVTYHCRTQNDQPQISSEHAGFRWVTPQEALALIQVDGIARDVKAFAAKKRVPGKVPL